MPQHGHLLCISVIYLSQKIQYDIILIINSKITKEKSKVSNCQPLIPRNPQQRWPIQTDFSARGYPLRHEFNVHDLGGAALSVHPYRHR